MSKDKFCFGYLFMVSHLYEKKDRLRITVKRTPVNPYPISISAGTAIGLSNYSYMNGVIKANLSGAGLCRLKLNAGRLPVVKLNGKKIHVNYKPDLHAASVELNLRPGRLDQIEIH